MKFWYILLSLGIATILVSSYFLVSNKIKEKLLLKEAFENTLPKEIQPIGDAWVKDKVYVTKIFHTENMRDGIAYMDCNIIRQNKCSLLIKLREDHEY